jgi:glycerol kinase
MAPVLAIDAGTTGVRAIVFSLDGARLGSAYREIDTRYPRAGWVEQDLTDIWGKTQSVISSALQEARLRPTAILSIGITNQRSSIAAWDVRGLRPLSPLLSWQDVRAADRATDLQSRGFFVTANVAVTKAEWILHNVGEVRDAVASRTLRLGGLETWLVAKLTGGAHLSDHANASTTGFYSYHQQKWDSGLLESVKISREFMPDIVECSGPLAVTDAAAFGAAVPIAGLCGDQQASLFGTGCATVDATKCSYGTSAMVDALSGASPRLGGPGTYPLVAWRLAGEQQTAWCTEGSVITAGAAIQWLRDGLGLIGHLGQIDDLASGADDTGGVWVVPALQGLGTPFLESRARGVIGGLSRRTDRSHIARALLEGIAHRVCDVAEAVWTGAEKPPVLRADGRASTNDLLLQRQADFLGVPVERGFEPEGAAWGVAKLASRAVGLADSSDDAHGWRIQRRFDPEISEDERQDRRMVWSRRIAIAREQVD